jgi:hypothetical protein
VGEPAAESEGGAVMRDPLSKGFQMVYAQRQRKLQKVYFEVGCLTMRYPGVACIAKESRYVALSMSI